MFRLLSRFPQPLVARTGAQARTRTAQMPADSRALFDHVFQGGASVEVWAATGSSPTQNWAVGSGVHKAYDKPVKGYIYRCDGGPSAKMQFPKDARTPLGLVQPYLTFQIEIDPDKPFSLELSVSDAAPPAASGVACRSATRTRRRLIFSTSIREAVWNPMHTRVPLDGVPRGRWVNLTLDLPALVEANFGATFGRLESLALGGACRLRKIVTFMEATVGPGEACSAEEDPSSVPRGLELPAGVEACSQMFSQGAVPAGTPLTPSVARCLNSRHSNRDPSSGLSSTFSSAPPLLPACLRTPRTHPPTRPLACRSCRRAAPPVRVAEDDARLAQHVRHATQQPRRAAEARPVEPNDGPRWPRLDLSASGCGRRHQCRQRRPGA